MSAGVAFQVILDAYMLGFDNIILVYDSTHLQP